jgi:pimeloyl-ACP methyl ester carboxylesterase
LLNAAGVEAIALDLPGHGDDPGGMVDLHGDTDRVRDILDAIDGDVVLVGHSYGGAVITGAGVHPAVVHLVYLCALALDQHETCSTAGADDPGSSKLSYEGRPNMSSGLIWDGDVTTLTEAGARAMLMNDCDEQTSSWMLSRLGGQPMSNFGQVPGAVAWRQCPSTYAICADDMIIHPGLQRILARRCTSTVEWPTGHSPFASRPDLVADLLVDLTRQ